MTQDELKSFLINLKLIYQHGVSHSKIKSKTNMMFAIHNSHYVVEQIVRERAKDMKFSDALHKIGFEEILRRVNDKQNIQDYNRLLQLNKIRNDAEHLNIIPNIDDVRFYVKIAGDFLKWSYKNYYDVEYDLLNLEDMIHDIPIRRVMLEAKDFIEKKELEKASQKMYEGLGALKFMFFRFFSDVRLEGIRFPDGNSLADLLADLAFKMLIAEDESALMKFLQVRTKFKLEEGKPVIVESVYPIVPFRDNEEANEHYQEILNIILTYQDRVPPFVWRRTE